MNFINAIWQCTFGRDKNVVAGQKVLEYIHYLLVKTIDKYEGNPHALTMEEIIPIKAICDHLVLANFPGLVDNRVSKRSKHVHYKHIYEDKTVSIGIFILPPGVSIPLHDHPRMSVISRVLYGSIHVKTYDFVKGDTVSNDKKRLARLRMDKIATAPYTLELLPDCGNLHELVGGDDIGCAFLDIITPPYDAQDGRDCSYFRVISSIDDEQNADETMFELESYELQDFDVILEAYDGPHLQRYMC
ncbi:unnamed protein product [Peronospora belbahrii]|uniref:Cysteine dioxygenase n=1 Tax=Peronospora belbahrii TaxID=622444 RepID=A0ABN8CPP8_9STRA|nr:unnamed protein product [Peronospora belbahrii]